MDSELIGTLIIGLYVYLPCGRSKLANLARFDRLERGEADEKLAAFLAANPKFSRSDLCVAWVCRDYLS